MLAGLLFSAACGPTGPEPVPVVLSLDNATARLAAATILVDYADTPATIAHDSRGPECAYISPFVTGEFTDDGTGRLTLRVRSNRGFTGPIDLAACRMIPNDLNATETTIRKSLKVSIVTAMDGEGKEIDHRSRRDARKEQAATTPSSEEEETQESKTDESTALEAAPGEARAPVKPAIANKPAAAPQAQPAPAPANTGAPAPAAEAKPAPKPATPDPEAKSAADRVRERIAANNPLGTKAGPSAPPPAPTEDVPEPGTGVDNYDDSPGFSPGLPEYELTVSIVEGDAELGALQFELDHLGNSGGFVSLDEQRLDCLFLGGMLGAANKQGRTAKIGLIDLDGMPEVGPVVTCAFRTRETISTGSFTVRVTDASDTETNAVSPLPVLAVTNVIPR
jgi:hypothetical protein